MSVIYCSVDDSVIDDTYKFHSLLYCLCNNATTAAYKSLVTYFVLSLALGVSVYLINLKLLIKLITFQLVKWN